MGYINHKKKNLFQNSWRY